MRYVSLSELDDFRRLLDRTVAADFDGHTEFDHLTPEQRLQWISQCALFVHEVNGKLT